MINTDAPSHRSQHDQLYPQRTFTENLTTHWANQPVHVSRPDWFRAQLAAFGHAVQESDSAFGNCQLVVVSHKDAGATGGNEGDGGEAGEGKKGEGKGGGKGTAVATAVSDFRKDGAPAAATPP